MSRRIIVASFAREEHLLGAVEDVRKRNWEIVDVYTPYAVHGLESALGWRRSLLPVACFVGGAAGVVLALWFQFWSTAESWPINIGGRPWNSLPAFVPVTFEAMVLFGGFTLVFAWLFRCRLYPGKSESLPLTGLTDDRFALAVSDRGAAAEAGEVQSVLRAYHAVELIEGTEGGSR